MSKPNWKLSNELCDTLAEEEVMRKKKKEADKQASQIRATNRLAKKEETLKKSVAELKWSKKRLEKTNLKLKIDLARDEGFMEGRKAAQEKFMKTQRNKKTPTPPSSTNSFDQPSTSTKSHRFSSPPSFSIPTSFRYSNNPFPTPTYSPTTPKSNTHEDKAKKLLDEVTVEDDPEDRASNPTPEPKIKQFSTYGEYRASKKAPEPTPQKPSTSGEPSASTSKEAPKPSTSGTYQVRTTYPKPEEYVPFPPNNRKNFNNNPIKLKSQRPQKYWDDLAADIMARSPMGKRLHQNPVDGFSFEIMKFYEGRVRVKIDGTWVSIAYSSGCPQPRV